jgi:hypothetical protein
VQELPRINPHATHRLFIRLLLALDRNKPELGFIIIYSLKQIAHGKHNLEQHCNIKENSLD